MEPLSHRAKFRWAVASFLIFAFLTTADILALLHAPPRWFSDWPHWTWQDWTSLGGDLIFPIMAMASLSDIRKYRSG